MPHWVSICSGSAEHEELCREWVKGRKPSFVPASPGSVPCSHCGRVGCWGECMLTFSPAKRPDGFEFRGTLQLHNCDYCLRDGCWGECQLIKGKGKGKTSKAYTFKKT